MRWQFLLLLAALLIVGDDDALEESEKLQGTWAVVSADIGGKIPENALKGLKVIIRRETILITEEEREREKTTFTLDPSKEPKAIDLSPREGTKKRGARGIYELEGDNLKLIWRKEGRRPTEFATTFEDPDVIMMTLKKEKKP